MDGTRYLPDFYIPGLNRWFEIKGNEEIGGDTYEQKMMELTTSAQNDND